MSESHFQLGWNVSWWSETSVSAWLNSVIVKTIRFKMAGMDRGPKSQFQHGGVSNLGFSMHGLHSKFPNCTENNSLF
jgi:hypothetical protein